MKEKELTAEDIIKAIDEIFDEEKLQESETFWRGYNHGITRVQQYIVKLNQELQRKDNIINEFKNIIENSEGCKIVGTNDELISKKFVLDVLDKKRS